MLKLYKKSEILFSILWIVVYVVGSSLADSLSKEIAIYKSLTFAFLAVISVLLFLWIKKNSLLPYYGFIKTDIEAHKFLYYIPLIILASCNLWLGFTMNFPIMETIFYLASMLFVGFLEELIFRGFLFKAMSKNNIKSAIIVSSVTFGIGHIINLINGSGTSLLSNILQVIYAIAFGFLFVIIVYRGKSIIPCIITHSTINMLSAFSNQPKNDYIEILITLILTVIIVSYTVFLLRTLPRVEKQQVIESN